MFPHVATCDRVWRHMLGALWWLFWGQIHHLATLGFRVANLGKADFA
jgi:hypothetical protein